MQQVYPNHEKAARPCKAYWLLLRQGRLSPMIGTTYVTVVPPGLHKGTDHEYWYLRVGATRVIIRPPTASTEQEMAEELERIAEAVIR